MKRKMWLTVCALLSALMLAACGTKSGDADSLKEREASEEKEDPGEKREQESTDTEEEETEPELETPEEEESRETESGGSEAIAAGTSMEDAAVLPLGEKAYGTVGGGESAWFSFTTDQNEDGVYNITFVNTTAGTYNLGARLCDEYGEELGSGSAGSDGTPFTIRAEELEPDTAYYIRLYPVHNEEIDYTLTVKDPDAGEQEEISEKEDVLSKTSEEEETGALDGDGAKSSWKKDEQEKNDLKGTAAENEEEELVPGSSQKDAVLLPLGTKVFGTVEENGNAWFAFTTGEDPEAVYKITAVNASPNTGILKVYLYDEYGTCLSNAPAQSDGVPATISAEELECDTTYYVRISPWGGGKEWEYSLIIKNPNDKTTAYRTAGTFSESQGAVSEEGAITAGTNANGAVLLSLGTKVSGTVEENGNAWFAFTTGEDPEAVYKITAVNASPNTGILKVYLYDEYGTCLSNAPAQSDGVPATISAEELECDTTYYVRISPWGGGEEWEYTLLIQSPEVKKEEPSPLVFEKPFEINETQVQFVINQAVFIDEDQAKEVLKPVAEAILEHPDHSILIAGTTATDMTQEQCVDLSLRRAEAVKRLLTDTYHVPESQLQIVGLGYEKDPFERGKDRDADGNFVESEGKKNRRVVILDIDDPIAQELLQNN